MLRALTLIFSCQLVGELISAAFDTPTPGPVIGMALLFVGLLIAGGAPEALEKTADAILQNLSLLFVPAGVGVMLHAQLLGRDWLPLSVALVASTWIGILATAVVMRRLAKGPETEPSEEKQ